MKVLVCGGRDYGDGPLDHITMDVILDELDISMVIHGAARGADLMADNYAKDHGIPVLAFPADWGDRGKAAGPERNQRMLDEGKPELVVAFPGGRGTADMVRRAKAAGVLVRQIA